MDKNSNHALKYNNKRLVAANKLLIKVRWYYVSALFVTGILSKITPGVSANANFPLAAIILMVMVTYGGNALFAIFFKDAEKKNIQAIKRVSYMQFFFDQVIVTAVIFFAGGIVSISFLSYFYAIAASGIFFSYLETVFFATTASLLYVGLIVLQYYDLIPYNARYNIEFENILVHNPSAVITNAWAVVSSFFIVGYFTGKMADMLLQKEKAIRQERDKNREIINSLSDGLIYIDEEDRISLMNPRAEELLRCPATEIINVGIADIKSEDHPILFQVLHGQGKDTISPFGKPELSYTINNIEIRDSDDKTLGSIRTIQDVSREKFIDRVKSEFITIASHQLRTPLSAIRNAMDLLRSGDYGKMNSSQTDILNKSVEYTNNLIMIVNDLLNVSSMEQGQFDYNFKKANLHFLLQEASEQFMPIIRKKDIDFSLEIKDKGGEVEVDDSKIKLVLGSIIDNAIMYTPKRGKIYITGEVINNKVIIAISDNGIGIPEAAKEKVFSKFFRAPNSMKVKTEGNGLDMFVAKEIVANHHGRIWFESEEGKGTSFFVELPTEQPKQV